MTGLTTDEYLLQLSTEVEPPKIFTVDGEEYRILGLEHMGKADEARVLALFARNSKLNKRLEDDRLKTAQAEQVAAALRDTRIELLSTLTDLPKEIAERLPMSAQVKLFRFISKDSGGLGEEDGEGVNEEFPGDPTD